MLDFRTKTFLEVCRSMNYTRAAEALHITQPAVSQHIRYLENIYGVKLFRYQNKDLSLTPEGEMLLRAMRQITNDEQLLREKMQSGSGSARTLSFGVTMTIGEYAVIPSLSRYLSAHPSENIHVRAGNTEQLLAGLQDGEIDFAIVEGYFPEGAYHTERFRQEDFIPVAAGRHTFCCGRTPRDITDLFGERLLIRESGSGTRNILERWLSLYNYSLEDFPRFVILENMHTIHRLLQEDCGISFLYRTIVEEDLRSGLLREIPLRDFHIRHDDTFLWRKDSICSDEIRRICLELRSPGE